jgi:hypothetical protein
MKWKVIAIGNMKTNIEWKDNDNDNENEKQ